MTIQQALELGLQHHSAGRLSEAENIYKQILQNDPKQSTALHLLGVIAYQVGKYQTAVELITKAITINPDFAEAHNNLGNVFMEQGKLEEAAENYHNALTINSDFAEAYCNLGNALKKLDRLEEANTRYREAIAINPKFAEAHNNLGIVYKGQGKLEDATASYQRALSIRSDFTEAHNNLGIALKEQGRMEDAAASYNRALNIRPEFAEAHYNLGNVYREQKKYDKAAARYHKAVTIKPTFAEAHSNLGIAYKELGKLADAVIHYRQALSIAPDTIDILCNLGIALKDLGKLDEAEICYRRALAIDPESAQVYSNLGNVLKEQGNLHEAVESYHKALIIKPDYAVACFNLANIYKDMGKLDEAVAGYQKAIVLEPDNAEAWNNLKFYTKAHQYTKFGGDCARGVELEGLNNAARATVNYAIHQSFLAGDNSSEADENYQKIIAALPSMAEQTITINDGAGYGGEETASCLPDRVVALLQYGRSGTGLIHSLVDGHPEISTLPGVYLRGYFNAGVWDRLSLDGWRGLAERFADEFAVLFDARASNPIPSRLGEQAYFMGKSEGMTSVGINRDEFLSLDRAAFCEAASGLMKDMKSIDPLSFLMVVHAAFEEVRRMGEQSGTDKHLCFYHIHNPDDFAMPNFLRYGVDARLLLMVREPIANCESLLRLSFRENNNIYDRCVFRILEVLFAMDQMAFRMRETIGVRLEDLKARPKVTLSSLCAWLEVDHSPTLYEMTAQDKKWWGDPSSPDYTKDRAMSPFGEPVRKHSVETILGEKDRFILATLFYPFSVRFGYREPDAGQFQKDLYEIRPLLDHMLEFEKTIAVRLTIDHDLFRQNGTYQLFRAGLVERWQTLDEFGDYPNMLNPLAIHEDEEHQIN